MTDGECEAARRMGDRDGHYLLNDWSHLLIPEARETYREAYESAHAAAMLETS